MMRILIFCLCWAFFLSANAQKRSNITTSGLSFSPSVLNVNLGDTVHFDVGASHPVLQVSESTWTANGSTALSGGFSFPSGVGNYITVAEGTFYYICTSHISSGMKGTIVVSGTTGFEKIKSTNELKIFPNPANDFITIQNSSDLNIYEIRIIDFTGKTVLSHQEPNSIKDNETLDIKNLEKGIYFISIISGVNKYTEKFVKL